MSFPFPFPEALALVHPEGVVTYGQLASRAEEAASRLKAAGLGPGTLVALRGDVGPDYLALLYGIWMAGGAVAPMHPRWTSFEEARALEALRPDLVLEGWDSLPPPRRRPPGGAPWEFGAISGPSAVWAHLFTSGTSGNPRVVRLTRKNLEASAFAARQRLGLRPEDRWLASLTPAHVGGLALVSRAAFVGCTLVWQGSFHPEAFLDAALRREVTHASLVPTMLHRILEAWGDRPAPSALRLLLVGGAPASPSLLEKAGTLGFPVAYTYGLTEASSQVATAPPPLTRRKPGTVGPPLPGVEVKVAASGELLVRGPTVAEDCVGKGGWLATGDLGEVDPEGHFWVTGRLSDRIVTGGVNVDPGEVEGVLLSHPGVREAVVLGVPDAEWGEKVVAVVVPGDGGGPPEAELDALVRSFLSPPKRPRAYRFVSAVPRNANGKVDRRALRELFGARSFFASLHVEGGPRSP